MKYFPRLISNILSLSGLQFVNTIVPILLIPYLIKTLGIEGFGIIALCQAVVSYGVIFVDYGFNFTATKNIAQSDGNNVKLSSIVSRVLACKLVLLSLFFVFSFAFFVTSDLLKNYMQVYAIFMIQVIGQMLMPTFLFQGMQNLKLISIITGTIKITSMLLIFVFVKNKNDLALVATFFSLGFLISGSLSLIYARKLYKVFFSCPSFLDLKQEFSDGFNVFLASIATTSYTTLLPLILSFHVYASDIGLFSAVQKLVNGLKGLLGPFSQAIFPAIGSTIRNDYQKAIKLINKVRNWFLVVYGLLFLFVMFFINDISQLLVGSIDETLILLIKIMILVPVFVLISNLYGVQYMINIGLERSFRNIIFFSSLVALIAGFFIIKPFGIIGAGLLITITELTIAIAAFSYYVMNGSTK